MLTYFLVSLPPLRRHKKPPCSPRAFLDQAADMLRGDILTDLALLYLLEEIDQRVTQILGANQSASSHLVDPEKFPELDSLGSAQEFYRYWYKRIEIHGRSQFLRNWAQFSLNFEEGVAALLARRSLTKADYGLERKGPTGELTEVIWNYYEQDDLGLSKRWQYYEPVNKALVLTDFLAMERGLNDLRWQEIDRLSPPGFLVADSVPASYFRLRILNREASFSVARGNEMMEKINQFNLQEIQ